MKPREERKNVILPVRIRQDSKWVDARIRNVSSRGIMIQMDDPPAKGTFLEVRRQQVVIVGQVRWSNGNCCGLRTQDKVPVHALKPNGGAPMDRQDERAPVERRASVRVVSPEEIAERSRLKAMLFQKVVLVAAGLIGAIFVATLIYELLSYPLSEITKHL